MTPKAPQSDFQPITQSSPQSAPYEVGALGGRGLGPQSGGEVKPRASDLIRATFDVSESGTWVERHGVTVRGTRPAWLDWPSHTAADMAPSQWPSVRSARVPRETKRKLA